MGTSWGSYKRRIAAHDRLFVERGPRAMSDNLKEIAAKMREIAAKMRGFNNLRDIWQSLLGIDSITLSARVAIRELVGGRAKDRLQELGRAQKHTVDIKFAADKILQLIQEEMRKEVERNAP